MRVKRDYLIISFSTTTNAILMERICNEKTIAGRLIPLPSEISAGCGLAWKTEINEKENIMKFMNENGIQWEMLHIIKMY